MGQTHHPKLIKQAACHTWNGGTGSGGFSTVQQYSVLELQYRKRSTRSTAMGVQRGGGRTFHLLVPLNVCGMAVADLHSKTSTGHAQVLPKDSGRCHRCHAHAAFKQPTDRLQTGQEQRKAGKSSVGEGPSLVASMAPVRARPLSTQLSITVVTRCPFTCRRASCTHTHTHTTERRAVGLKSAIKRRRRNHEAHNYSCGPSNTHTTSHAPRLRARMCGDCDVDARTSACVRCGKAQAVLSFVRPGAHTIYAAPYK